LEAGGKEPFGSVPMGSVSRIDETVQPLTTETKYLLAMDRRCERASRRMV
jgi:hypothetical protein